MQYNVLVLLEGEEGASARYWILECGGLPAGHLLAGPIYAQGHWRHVGWNITNMQFAGHGLESDKNIGTA